MKRSIKVSLSVLLTIGLVALLIKQIGSQELLGLFREFTWEIGLIGFLLYLSSYFLRCWRWRYFFPGQDINLLDLFSLTSLTIVSQNILPGGSGEVSFVLVLKKIFNISYSRGIIAMIVARLFDLIAMLLVFSVALLLLLQDKRLGYNWLILVGVLVAVLGLAIYKLDRLTALLIRLNNRIARHLKKLAGLSEKLAGFQENIVELHKSKVYGKVFGVSLVNQVVRFVAFQKMVEAIINREFSLLSTIYGSTFSEISSKIPIHGVLGLGTYEVSWVGPQMLMGMSKEEAVLSAFGLHAVLLIFSAIMGGLGLIIMLYRKRGINAGQP